MKHFRNDLTALLGSRICHDLISPLGAISNGLELLHMTGQPHTPEFRLIADSIDNANSKIRFFRVAYGAAPLGVTLARAEIFSILRDHYKDSRLEVIWNPVHELQRSEVRIAFLLLQCLETTMPYGGTIEVNTNPKGWNICATAEKLRFDSHHWEALEQKRDLGEISPPLVHFGVLGEIMDRRKSGLSVKTSDTEIQIRF